MTLKPIVREQIIREIFEDADIFGFIALKADPDVYDKAADAVNSKVDKDHTIDQMQKVIWEAFYKDLCIGEVAGTKERWELGREQAKCILGESSRFRGISMNIRDKVMKP